MFNTHRRDILNFDNYMDLKKPGFGGPKSAIELRDSRGKLNDPKPKLGGFRRTVERDPAFSHPVYDPTYKAMTGDLVYKQEGKKRFTYDDRRSGIPVVQMDPIKEGKTYTSFQRFVNEEIDDEEMEREATRSNATFSDLRSIEAKLRKFETGDSFDEEEEEFGANPDEMTPFGPVPDWVKELNASGEYEAGGNPGECSECGDSDWMR